jgi:hypothetical protein
LSSAGLELETLTSTCVANQAQDFFEVVNNSTSGVKVSDLTIKFWLDDTSGSAILPHVWTGGCLTNQTGCFHQVGGVTASAVPFAPACGSDSSHQANWEITISSTDQTVLAPGVTWANIQTAVNLANFANFSPGEAKWFSPCLSPSNYTADAHFAVYNKGNLVFSSGLSTPSCRSPHGTQQLSGYVTPEVAAAPVVGPVPPAMTMNLAVSLPLINRTQLAAFASAVSDPQSPSYRQFLTASQFAATYGPLQSDLNALTTFVQSKGLTVTHTAADRSLITVTGPASAVEQAFYVNLNFAQRPDGTQFVAPDREPSLDLATVVNHIAGLQTFSAGRIPNTIASVQGSGTGSGMQGTYLPADLRRAYTSCTTLDGAGQSIGLFEINGAWNPDDVTKFENAGGITNAPTPIALLGDGITTSNIDFTSSGSINAAAETVMDIDLALTFAPRAQVYVSIGQNIDTIIQALLDQTPQINQISSSDGFFEANDSKISDQLMTMAARGITFFVDSGDFGAYSPGDSNSTPDLLDVGEPQFTVVGGTTLSLTPTSMSETTWNQGGEASGGGVVTSFAIPSYQKAVDMSHNNGSTSNRNVPDVSMIANTNIQIFISCGPSGSCTNAVGPGQSPRTGILDFGGGTSAATPLWASFTALVNEVRQTQGLSPLGLGIGTINPTLYAIGQDSALYGHTFNDIADGSNNRLNSSQPTFPAVAGYDLSTGWGSPKCALINQLASNSPTGSCAVATPDATANAPFEFDTGEPPLQAIGASYGSADCPGQFLVDVDMTQPGFAGLGLFVVGRWSNALTTCDETATMTVFVTADGTNWQIRDVVQYAALPEAGGGCHEQTLGHTDQHSNGLGGTSIAPSENLKHVRVAITAFEGATVVPVNVFGETNTN